MNVESYSDIIWFYTTISINIYIATIIGSGGWGRKIIPGGAHQVEYGSNMKKIELLYALGV